MGIRGVSHGRRPDGRQRGRDALRRSAPRERRRLSRHEAGAHDVGSAGNLAPGGRGDGGDDRSGRGGSPQRDHRAGGGGARSVAQEAHARHHRLRLSHHPADHALGRPQRRRRTRPAATASAHPTRDGSAVDRSRVASSRRCPGGAQRRARRSSRRNRQPARHPDGVPALRPRSRAATGEGKPDTPPGARALQERPAVAAQGPRPRREPRRRARPHSGLPALQQRPGDRDQRPRAGHAPGGPGRRLGRTAARDRRRRAQHGRSGDAQRLPRRGSKRASPGAPSCARSSSSARRTRARRSSAAATG